MSRDWRKVAMAVLAAAAVASVCALASSAEAQRAAKSGKASAKPAPADDDDDPQEKASAKKKRQDPAEAQRAVEQAGKLLQGGKAEQATHALTATLAGGNLPPATMAKALYLRGMAYRQQSKPAQAISDLTSALWLKGGLTAEDRADALKQRAGAYADAGLTETGQIAAAAAPASKAPTERSGSGSWGIVTTPAENAASNKTQASQAGGNWFKNWFNAWSPAPAPSSGPPATASVEPEKAGAPPAGSTRVGSAWSSRTEVRAEVSARPDREEKSVASAAHGKYSVLLATVRSRQEAASLAAKAKRALGGAVEARELEIDQAVLGNMGSFYRVKLGPFATVHDTQAICAKVRSSGFDCLTITQ